MVLAEYAEMNAKRLLAGSAVLARSVADSRIDDDPVADHAASFRVLADRVDDTGRIGAHDPWRTERHARQPFEHEEIEMIESRSRHAHAHLSRGHFGNRQIRRGTRACRVRRARRW